MSIINFGMFRKIGPQPPEAPIRAELFSVERLEQHARVCGAQHIAPNPRRGVGSPNGFRTMRESSPKAISRLLRRIQSICQSPPRPNGCWITSTSFEEQVREIRADLPPASIANCQNWRTGHCRDIRACSVLPGPSSPIRTALRRPEADAFRRRLPAGAAADHRRVMGTRITLRITLVENLRRLAEAIHAQQTASQLADALADQILNARKVNPNGFRYPARP